MTRWWRACLRWLGVGTHAETMRSHDALMQALAELQRDIRGRRDDH